MACKEPEGARLLWGCHMGARCRQRRPPRRAPVTQSALQQRQALRALRLILRLQRQRQQLHCRLEGQLLRRHSTGIDPRV